MSDFLFVPLRPFFYAALAKRLKVQFRQVFAYLNNNVDSKRHIIIRTAILYIYIYIFTASTPLRKDTGVFESLSRFIGLKCHSYALYLCFVYKQCNTRKPSYVTLSRIMTHIYIYT